MTRRPPRFVDPVQAAMHRLRLRYEDVVSMRNDLLAALARSNNDLVHSFNRR